jgi:hypothetical protein
LEFKRNVLLAEAYQAAARADWLNGYLQRGDNLTSQASEQLSGGLEPLPEAVKAVAA